MTCTLLAADEQISSRAYRMRIDLFDVAQIHFAHSLLCCGVGSDELKQHQQRCP